MCCLVSALLFIGPRLGFILYWLFSASKVNEAFGNWIFPILGLVFLPWTALVWVIFFPIGGIDWVFVAIAFLADLAAYGGGWRNRGRFSSN
jgi:hypothetical protein